MQYQDSFQNLKKDFFRTFFKSKPQIFCLQNKPIFKGNHETEKVSGQKKKCEFIDEMFMVSLLIIISKKKRGENLKELQQLGNLGKRPRAGSRVQPKTAEPLLKPLMIEILIVRKVTSFFPANKKM